MTDEELKARLSRIETRQEVLARTMGSIVDVMEITRDEVHELLEWSQEPPSSDLGATLAKMTAVLGCLQEIVVTVGRRQDEIAAAVRQHP